MGTYRYPAGTAPAVGSPPGCPGTSPPVPEAAPLPLPEPSGANMHDQAAVNRELLERESAPTPEVNPLPAVVAIGEALPVAGKVAPRSVPARENRHGG